MLRSQTPSHSGAKPAIADSLYFGTARANGDPVTEQDWQSFIEKEITPRFPHGLTSWQASGQWLATNGIPQQERSYILQIIHPDTPKDEQSIREIISNYRKVFQQESVLRARSSVWISY